MIQKTFQEPKYVLIYTGAQELLAVMRSLNTASDLCNLNLQAISFCCTGKYVSSGGLYFRHVDPKVEIEFVDFYNLSLSEYDKMCGVVRRYHPEEDMLRRRILEKQHKLFKY